jgi:hypothetical protein
MMLFIFFNEGKNRAIKTIDNDSKTINNHSIMIQITIIENNIE